MNNSIPSDEDLAEPKISVVIPAYNEEKFLPKCLESLQQQSFKDFEIIVVDNNCTDKTAEIAKSYGAKVVAEKRKGVCFARQCGVSNAKSKIIVSSDADCTYKPNWLQNIYQAFIDNSGTVAVTGPFQFGPTPKWGRIYSNILFKTVSNVYNFKGKLIYVGASNFAFLKEAWQKVGGYNTALAQGGDEFDLLKKINQHGDVIFIKENTVDTSSRRMVNGMIYNLLVSIIWYYIVDYYVIARITGKTLAGQYPDYREDIDPNKKNYRASLWSFAIIAMLFALALPVSPKLRAETTSTRQKTVKFGKEIISVTRGMRYGKHFKININNRLR